MKAVSFLVGVLICLQSMAQADNDTLKVAQQMVQNKELNKAEQILEAYHQSNQNPYTYQLHAQLLYWSQKNQQAAAIYEKGIEAFPDAHFLRLDYGYMLFQLGKLNEAYQQLEKYVQTDSLHAESYIMLAYLELWQGNTKAALQRISLLRKHHGTNDSVRQLVESYNRFYSDVVKAGFSLHADDQPLRSQQFNLDFTMYRSALFAPYIRGAMTQFSEVPGRINTSWVQAGNLWQFGFGATKIRTGGGVFMNRITGNQVTGEISLRQKLNAALNLELAAVRLPYQFTVSSIMAPFLHNFYSGALQFERKYLAARAVTELQRFDDGNSILTFYAWSLIPLVKREHFTWKAGYSFGYSNAKQSSFTATKTANAAAQSQDLYTQVQGLYVPYFTPTNQQVHAFLLNIAANIHRSFRIQGSSSFGFYANADNPYLLLEKSGNTFFISRNFYQQAYTPIEAELNVETALSSPLSLQLKYMYSRLFFYTRNQASLQLNYRFIK
jgi:hypothetical protein